MAKITKAQARENKNRKAQQGMRVSNRSIFVIQAVQIKKGAKAKND
jgi:hypothetical protein